ncbi:MAG: 16S rRNA (cytosine(1402)-N(4))-methyltransferase RsmH [bacterium]|nr:16S rRNA (cytosine(1402)-N(4))-methyltransferase RsmH [bacterium]
MHTPVLLKEVRTALEPMAGDLVIDGTGGSGGHAEALLEYIGRQGKLLILDWDPDAAKKLAEKFARDPRVTVVAANFASLREILGEVGWSAAHKLLLDLGFSSEQIEGSGRGFSFRRNEPLVMTYSPDATPVKTLLKELSEEDLAVVIREYGEERYAKRIAHAIRERMRKKPIETSGELADVIRGAVPPSYRRGRIDPATRTFQALRIFANSELENVRRVLSDLDGILFPGGRAAVIAFHSLEDRIVKEEFRRLYREKGWHLLAKKPITASREEISKNPRARSAKLRAIEKPSLVIRSIRQENS